MKIVKKILVFATMAAAAQAPSAVTDDRDAAMRALQSLDARVLAVGYRLASASADLCADKAPLAGLALHDMAQYDPAFRPAAARAFGLGERPAVLAVAPDGPAARAGLRAGDEIVAIDGAAVAPVDPRKRAADYGGVERLLDRIDAASDDGKVRLSIIRDDRPLAVDVVPQGGCRGRFQIVPEENVNAAADGRYVQISSAFAEYAARDGELVATLAHELAHNILRHRARLDAAGISRGLFKHVGRNARLVRATEIEADRLSVWLIDRAGYSVDEALAFWKRYRRERGLGIFNSPTHPGWKERIAIMEAEAAILASLKRTDPRPTPPILSAPLPPLD